MFKIKSTTPGGLAQPQRRGGAAPAGAHPRAAPGSAGEEGEAGLVNPKNSARKSFLQPKELPLLSRGAAGRAGITFSCRNYLLLQALLFFLHVLHLRLQLPDLSDVCGRLRKEKVGSGSSGIRTKGSEQRAGSCLHLLPLRQ